MAKAGHLPQSPSHVGGSGLSLDERRDCIAFEKASEMGQEQGHPYTHWCFSWESLVENDYDAVTYGFHCPGCLRQPIEIYADKLIDECVWPCFFGSGEVFGLIQVVNVINKIVVHELCHWAGSDEDAAIEAETISQEEASGEDSLSAALHDTDGAELFHQDIRTRPLPPEHGAKRPPPDPSKGEDQ